MIRRHDFNSAWWGEEVGFVEDLAFFALDPDAQHEALSKFAWVELVQPVSALTNREQIALSRFYSADVQVRFRIDLARVQPGEGGRALTVRRGGSDAFGVNAGEIRAFRHERFYALPGGTEARVTERYARWAVDLWHNHPATALQFELDGRVQGWFLAEPGTGRGLELKLAMLSTNATASGYDLYARAMEEYASAGFHVGCARFSVSNSAVHNIYSGLGARFVEPWECWLWTRASPYPSGHWLPGTTTTLPGASDQ